MNKDTKPEYRFECLIKDIQNDAVVVMGSTFINNEKRLADPILGMEQISEESAELEFWSMFRAFRNKLQEEYEEREYKEDNEEENESSN